jgi:zinc protease
MTRRELLAMTAAGVLSADHMHRAPMANAPLTVKLPQADATKLANGVTVLAMEDDRLPIAQVRFQFEGAGAIYSPHPGVAEITAEMLREGGARRSGREIVNQAARLGATLASSAPAGAEVASAEGSGLTSRFAEWVNLLADVALHPSFPADEFSIARQRLIFATQVRLTKPATVAFDNAARILYGSHPAALTAPPVESLASLTPDMPAAWHRERYTPGKLVVSCIGRVKPSAFLSQIEKLLGAWKAPEAIVPFPPNPQPAGARRVVLIDRPGAAQTEVVIGNLLFDRRDPELFPFAVMNSVLGGSMGSRLYQILRNEKGYVSNLLSVWTATRFPGFWQVRVAARTDATADTIVLEQLRRMCDEPIPTAELEAGKRGVVGNFALNLEQPGQVIGQSYLRYRYGFSPDYWERYPARMMAVTASEAQSVARKYADPTRALIVAVGDAATIRPALEKFGKVELS